MANFRIIRNYGAIPCSVTYSILDSSLVVLFSETVTNPPIPAPSGNMPGTPVYAEIIVSGNKVIVDLNCCCPIQLYCNCTPLNAYHMFKICVEPDPGLMADYLVTVNI